MRPLMWVSKSQEKLADELAAQGHDVCPNTVGRLLVEELEYSRQVNRKMHEGSSHPDRNRNSNTSTRRLRRRRRPASR
jgi:arginine repressor